MNALSQRYRVPLGVPYWTGATYRALLRSALRGRLIDGPDLDTLNSLIRAELGVEEVLLCGSGSLALELALRSCGVGSGDEVILPAFCCAAVLRSIRGVGARPVLADSDADLNVSPAKIEAVLGRATKAVVVPHLFGNPADIRAIVELAHGRGLRVIDDAAQALGATLDGRALGSFGDAGVLSFGHEKICAGLGGGALILRRQDRFQRTVAVALPAPRLPSALRQLGSTLLWHRWRRWSAPLEALLYCEAGAGPDLPPAPYRQEAMPNLHAAVAASLVQSLTVNIAARRKRVEAYKSLLGGEEGLKLVPHRPGSACLTQVVRVLPSGSGEDLASEVIDTLRRAGFEVQGSYVPLHLLPQWDQNTCRLPHVERVWGDLVELPCEPEVGLDDIERIAAVVRRVIHEHGGR